MYTMRIAIVAPNLMPLSENSRYGGTERMVSELTGEWSSKCKDIALELYCADGSAVPSATCDVKTFASSSYPKEFLDGELTPKYLLDHGNELDEWYSKSRYNQRKYEDFVIKNIQQTSPDVLNVHMHSERLLGMLAALNVPTIVNLHNDPRTMRLRHFEQTQYVALSESQRLIARTFLTNTVTIDAGIRLPDPNIEVDPVATQNDFLLYVGAMSRRKGVKTVLEVAASARLPIVLAGPVLAWSSRHLEDTANYFLQEIAPHIDDENVMYIGSVDEETRNNLMSKASGLVVASGHEDQFWQESFGRVVPESLAFGTPVIASKSTTGAVDRLDSACSLRFQYPTEVTSDVLGMKANSNGKKIAHEYFDMQRYSLELMTFISNSVGINR